MAEVVQRGDGYPEAHVPDILAFLGCPGAYGAWVAAVGPEIVGHVVLNTRSSTPVMELACAVTGRPPDGLGVVARLLVAPSHRRLGIARVLLDTAAGAARSAGLWPVLDTVAHNYKAINLYESAGWALAGKARVTFSDGTQLDEVVYLGPPPGQEPGDPGPGRLSPP
jgi:GNAT superfamily N-acetyltransferase